MVGCGRYTASRKPLTREGNKNIYREKKRKGKEKKRHRPEEAGGNKPCATDARQTLDKLKLPTAQAYPEAKKA